MRQQLAALAALVRGDQVWKFVLTFSCIIAVSFRGCSPSIGAADVLARGARRRGRPSQGDLAQGVAEDLARGVLEQRSRDQGREEMEVLGGQGITLSMRGKRSEGVTEGLMIARKAAVNLGRGSWLPSWLSWLPSWLPCFLRHHSQPTCLPLKSSTASCPSQSALGSHFSSFSSFKKLQQGS